MKKILAVVLLSTMMFILVACTETGSSSGSKTTETTVKKAETVTETQAENTEKETEVATEASPAVTKTANDVALELSQKVGGGEVDEKIGAFIGAEEGAYFKVGENVFEIYLFKNEEKIIEAKTGTFSFTIEGFGDFSLNSFVNGNFVLLCETVDEVVIDAFKEIK